MLSGHRREREGPERATASGAGNILRIQGRRRGKENAKNRAKHGPASDKLISFLKGFCVFTERKKGSLRFFRPIPFPYPYPSG
nr:hypothetical protein [Bacillaceae bacterium]